MNLLNNMEIYRIEIKGWTASFRYPAFIYTFQPSLPVPPYSTVYGIISAACGRYITPKDVKPYYVFKYKGKSVDLEKIYKVDADNRKRIKKKPEKTDVIRREFFIDPQLYLYIEDDAVVNCFKKPYYPLLLGRSSDLAFVKEIKKIKLLHKKGFQVGGIVLDYSPKLKLDGIPHALPMYFTDTVPRKSIGVHPSLIVSDFQYYSGTGWVDEEKGWGVILDNISET